MRIYPERIASLTDGERGMLLAFVSVGLLGAAVSISVIGELVGQTARIADLRPFDVWTVASGALGACAGLFIMRDWFGLPGASGVKWAALGALMVSFLASIVGGSLILPFYGTMFAPLAAVLTLYENLALTLFWLASLSSAHLLIGQHRGERDTIFATKEDDGIPV